MTRLVSILHRDANLYISTQSRTVDRFWLGDGDPDVLPATVSDAGLGRVVLDAISRSRADLPRPEDLNGLHAPLMRAAKVRSLRALYRGARLVSVSQDGGQFTVEAHTRDGSTFYLKSAAEEVLEQPDPESLGRAVRSALDQSS